MASPAWPTLYQFFGRSGLLASVHKGYEYRPTQLEMAEAVAAALGERRHLLVEAGTGTGKTLAYLFPALSSGRRVLISTGTRNLQEQLAAKDVPLLQAALGRPIRAVTMKGRQNYACRQKLIEFSRQPALLAADDHWAFERIHAWVETTATGDQAELAFLPENSPLWTRVNARRETCTGSKCPQFDACFLTTLRQNAAAADLVIVNHHLFFADLALKRQGLEGVLPPYEAVILDEAHEVEPIAGQYFRVAVTSHQIEDLARDGLTVLRLKGLADENLELRLQRLQRTGLELFAHLAPEPGRQPCDDREAFARRHAEPYGAFVHALQTFESGLDNLSERPEEVRALARRAAELRTRLQYLVESDDRGAVFWTERRGRHIALQAEPLDVGTLLDEVLFSALDTVVLTSATLTVDDSFAFARGRLGLRHARECLLASPFAFDRQAVFYIAEHLPDPREADYLPRAVDEIEALLTCSQGRAFVLCTSTEQMRRLHERLVPRLPFPLLLQGGEPRHLLLERFRHTPNAVLFATASFWQGVDVQGEQLSCVIVDRLPFASPADPVVAARIRALREQGARAFADYQVPEAVLALKQGLGRLIRSARDRGVVALLDSRILRKSYGRRFLRSLPEFAGATRLEDVRAFFARGIVPRLTVHDLAGPDPDADEPAESLAHPVSWD